MREVYLAGAARSDQFLEVLRRACSLWEWWIGQVNNQNGTLYECTSCNFCPSESSSDRREPPDESRETAEGDPTPRV